jgi:hypothetical protein
MKSVLVLLFAVLFFAITTTAAQATTPATKTAAGVRVTITDFFKDLSTGNTQLCQISTGAADKVIAQEFHAANCVVAIRQLHQALKFEPSVARTLHRQYLAVEKKITTTRIVIKGNTAYISAGGKQPATIPYQHGSWRLTARII